MISELNSSDVNKELIEGVGNTLIHWEGGVEVEIPPIYECAGIESNNEIQNNRIYEFGCKEGDDRWKSHINKAWYLWTSYKTRIFLFLLANFWDASILGRALLWHFVFITPPSCNSTIVRLVIRQIEKPIIRHEISRLLIRLEQFSSFWANF